MDDESSNSSKIIRMKGIEVDDGIRVRVGRREKW